MNKKERYRQILNLDNDTEVACFLPWIGEFGWYIMNHVKRIHGYRAKRKIAFIKPGHESLFPSVDEFLYDWHDITDERKTGINKLNKLELQRVLQIINDKFPNSKVVYHTDTFWEEKKSLAHITFEPINRYNNNLYVDVVIAPRRRKVDKIRNLGCWQLIVNNLVNAGLSVGVVGSRETSVKLKGIKYNAYDYIDIDSDIELIRNSKFCVMQESGMAYLAMMLKKPLFILDHYHKEMADLHRDHSIPFGRIGIKTDWRTILNKI